MIQLKDNYIYVVRYGYSYEHDNILGAYTSRYKAKKAIKKESLEGGKMYQEANSRNGYVYIDTIEII